MCLLYQAGTYTSVTEKKKPKSSGRAGGVGCGICVGIKRRGGEKGTGRFFHLGLIQLVKGFVKLWLVYMVLNLFLPTHVKKDLQNVQKKIMSKCLVKTRSSISSSPLYPFQHKLILPGTEIKKHKQKSLLCWLLAWTTAPVNFHWKPCCAENQFREDNSLLL